MMEAMEKEKSDEEPDPVELNSFEFFVQALSYLEGEAKGKLSSSERARACSRIVIIEIKSAILNESQYYDWSQLLNEST